MKRERRTAPRIYELIQQSADMHGLTVGAWCRQHGIPDSTVSRWRTALTEPDTHSRMRVAEAIGVSLAVLDEFVDGHRTTRMPPPPDIWTAVRADPDIPNDRRLDVAVAILGEIEPTWSTETRLREARRLLRR